ncbi:MAG: chaperone modulator CbpM [Chloroflexota bacterium]
MPHEIVRRAKNNERLYLRSVVAQIARVTPDFLALCEREELIEAQAMPDGEAGFSETAIRQLMLIRRLHYELALDLEAIDVVIHLRRQVLDLQGRLAAFEQQARQREQTLVSEIFELRESLLERQKSR